MYHHHSQQQGTQSFSNGPRPPLRQPPPNQHNPSQNPSPSNMLSQVMGFQFPRPTQLPDELESALAIRGGARDMDHRVIDHMNRPNQGSGSRISQHGSYNSNPVALTSDNQPAHQQGVDWSSYQPPTKLFANPPSSASHQSQRHHGSKQQPHSSHAGTTMPNWTAPVSDSPSPKARQPHGGSGGDGQTLYTPESAGSILASFGLSNEDLEVLSHYPDDQLTPDTLPFILRDIQINKSGNQKNVASTSSTSFSRGIQDMPLAPSSSSGSRSPEVPSLLTVTQTAGQVIDYGHASRAKEESSARETFKREQLSNERTVKLYPPSSSSSSIPKVDKGERRQVHLEHTDSSKHGDRDYRRTSSEHRKTSRSPGREFPPTSKSRNLDRDYRHDAPKPRPTSEAKSEASSRRSLSSSSGSKLHSSSSKKLPTPTMISDFSAVSPKVYPHTCSLCHTQCDQEKDWVDHINTVNHTAACRDLRNKFPGWRPNIPSRSGRYGSRALWDPKTDSPSHSVSRSLSGSHSPSPPHSKFRVGPHPHRLPYSPHDHPRHHHYTGSSHFGVKRPHDDSSKVSAGHPSSYKPGHTSKHGSLQSSTKALRSALKPAAKATKTSVKPPPAKKKKKTVTPASQRPPVTPRLVYLTGIPKDASEQEVTDLVGSFGKINNVILMPCSEEESEKGEGQKASVCMVKAEDAQALAISTNLSIRDQQITASVATKLVAENGSDANSSKPAPSQDKGAAGEESGCEADQKTSDDEKGTVLITGFPESGWSESDVIELVQPYGTPSDVIQAAQLGKALVSLPDMAIAQEMVKVQSSSAKFQDSELKMQHLKQRVSFSTPVALYNLLMGSMDSLESSAAVSWSCLLVISNVPNTPSGPSEVQKLVRRFGTVIKTLVLNSMVICEMATAAMALSVYQRFRTFPCIIHNNPLFFSRKPDPKANPQSRVITAYHGSSEDKPVNDSQAAVAALAAADQEETAHKGAAEATLEGIEKEDDVKDEKMEGIEKEDDVKDEKMEGIEKDGDVEDEMMEEIEKVEETENEAEKMEGIETDEAKKMEERGKEADERIEGIEKNNDVEEDNTNATEKTGGEDEDVGENCSKDDEMKKDELPIGVSEQNDKQDANLDIDMMEKSAVETVMETKDEDKTGAGEETKPSRDDDAEAASQQAAMPEPPEVTQEVVNTLLVECQTRTSKHPEDEDASTNGEQAESQAETVTVEKTKDETKEEEEAKKLEREHKEREARKERDARKEREAKERERKERARRAWEKEERAKREERARRKREEERWERERRERKRAYDERLSRSSRSSSRSDIYKQSSRKDERYHDSEQETKMEEEDCEDFPFNLSDFVTVDEVGDVNDLPASSYPTVAMETTDGSVQQDPPEDTPTEASTETAVSDVTPEESDGLVSAAEAVAAAETSEGSGASDLNVIAVASPADSPQEPTCHPEAPEAELSPDSEAILDSTAEAEPLPVCAASASPLPADSSSVSPETGAVTSESDVKCEKEDSNYSNHSEADKEETMSGKSEEQEKETGAPAPVVETVLTVKHQKSEDQSSTDNQSVKNKLQKELPPFDPSSPVGMEFLVPKTGFFCKVCNRFFSGGKEAEMNHCKTLKHYENLQKFLKTSKITDVTTKPDST